MMSVLGNRYQGTGNILEKDTKTCVPQLNPVSPGQKPSPFLCFLYLVASPERREKGQVSGLLEGV